MNIEYPDRYILKSGDLLVVPLTQSFTGVNVWSTSCLFFQPTRLVGAIAIAMGFSSTAFADQSTNATKLDTIVVTASRSEEKVKECSCTYFYD
jgi:hypothetical protein